MLRLKAKVSRGRAESCWAQGASSKMGPYVPIVTTLELLSGDIG